MSDAGWTRGREHGSPALVRLIIWITLRLGWPVGQALLYPITAYFYARLPAARLVSRAYLRRALGREATRGDVWRHFFTYSCVILDRICFLSGRMAGFRIGESGLDGLTKSIANGRGCVLLGAHLGSFEALRAFARRSPVPVRALMYRGTTGALSRFVEALDPALQDSIIEIGAPEAMLRVREAVERGEIVGILADRAPSMRRQATAEFLGAPASFPTGPLLIAASLGVPVLLFFAPRVGSRHYRIVLEPFAERIDLGINPGGEAREAALGGWVARFAARLETHCRAHPFNWFNFYDFWEAGGDAARRRMLAGTVALLGGPARAQPHLPESPSPAAAPIDELMRRLAEVPEVRADFLEEKTVAALTAPLRSEGWLLYRRPDHLEKVTTAPLPESLMVDGARLSIIGPDRQARVIDLDSQPALASLVDAVRGTLSGDLPRLRDAYDVTMDGAQSAWRLTLTPTRPALARLLRQVAVEGAGTSLRTVRTVQADGDASLMTIRPPA